MSQYAKYDRQYIHTYVSEGTVCYSPHMTLIGNNSTQIHTQAMQLQQKRDTRREW